MVTEVGGLVSAARAIILAAALLFAANAGYGLAHEAAHAAVIEAAGGHVYAIYVNVFGFDAYTEHSPLPGVVNLVLVNLAGLSATSVLALVSLAFGQELLAAFLAARTMIYALDYAQGTDIATIHAAIGSPSMGISTLIVVVNLACIFFALVGEPDLITVAKRKVKTGLFMMLKTAPSSRKIIE